jgi:hypothetical protein
MRFLDVHPEVVLLGSNARAIDANGKPMNIVLRSPMGDLAIRWTLMFNTAFIHTSVIFSRKIIWEQMGGYNESLLRTQDFEMWSRIARNFAVENLPDVLVDHRHEYGSIVSFLPRIKTLIEDVIHNNLRAFLQTSNIPAKWAHYIADTRLNDQFKRRNDWDDVIKMYDQIYFMFCQLHPEARRDKAVRSHLAGSLYDAAYCSAPRNRWASLRAFERAKKLGPKRERQPSFIKYVALWCLGEWIWHAYRRIRYLLENV